MITKAIVPMAGLGTRLYPVSVVLPKGLMPFVLPDGTLTTGLQLIVGSLLAAGVSQIAIVVSPENRAMYEAFLEGGGLAYATARAHRPAMQQIYDSLQQLRCHLTFIEQSPLSGLGHAVWCARAFADGAPVLVLLGDHLLLPLNSPAPLTPILQLYQQYQSPVYGVHRVPLEKVAMYGILKGKPTAQPRVYRMDHLCEKPTPEHAQQHLRTDGLPPDQFFAHSGIYAFPPTLWQILEQIAHEPRSGGEWTLTVAQQRLLQQGDAYLYESEHPVLDFGTPAEYRRAFCTIASYSHA